MKQIVIYRNNYQCAFCHDLLVCPHLLIPCLHRLCESCVKPKCLECKSDVQRTIPDRDMATLLCENFAAEMVVCNVCGKEHDYATAVVCQKERQTSTANATGQSAATAQPDPVAQQWWHGDLMAVLDRELVQRMERERVEHNRVHRRWQERERLADDANHKRTSAIIQRAFFKAIRLRGGGGKIHHIAQVLKTIPVDMRQETIAAWMEQMGVTAVNHRITVGEGDVYVYNDEHRVWHTQAEQPAEVAAGLLNAPNLIPDAG